MKRKTEEMKAKMYSLSAQAMESNRRIVEMQSTIDSLKDEQKIMESALEEKQKEIKLQRETNIDPEKENQQMIALMESLKQKETEIEDLKRRYENPTKILSVSTDDPSNPQTNLNETPNYSNGENSLTGNRSDDTSTTLVNSENTARLENRIESKAVIVDRREESIEQLTTVENSAEGLRNEGAVDVSHGNSKGNSQDNGVSVAGQENNIANATEGIASLVGKVSQVENTDNDMKLADEEKHKVARDEQLGLKSSQQEEDRDQGTFKGGVKLELTDNTRSSSSRAKGKHAKGKRWRMLARNRKLENNRNYERNEDQSQTTRRFSHHDQGGQLDTQATASNEGRTDSERVMSRNNLLEVIKADDLSNAKLLEPRKFEESENLNVKPVIDDPNDQLEKVHGMWKRPHVTQGGQLLTNESFHKNARDIRSKDKKERLDEVRQYEGQEISGIEESRNNRNMSMQNGAETVNAALSHERTGEMVTPEIDRQPGAGTGDFYKESDSDFDEDKREYKEETDESEF